MACDVHVRQGDSLLLTLTFQNDDGSGVELTNATITGQVRTVTGDLVATLSVTNTPVLNVATVQVSSTALWPWGMLLCDLKLIANGLIQHTEIFGIRVARSVTQ